jgi:hypothetical protein
MLTAAAAAGWEQDKKRAFIPHRLLLSAPCGYALGELNSEPFAAIFGFGEQTHKQSGN